MRGDDEPIKTKQTGRGGGTGSECVHRITSERWLVSLFILAIHATLASCRTCVHKHTTTMTKKKERRKEKIKCQTCRDTVDEAIVPSRSPSIHPFGCCCGSKNNTHTSGPSPPRFRTCRRRKETHLSWDDGRVD